MDLLNISLTTYVLIYYLVNYQTNQNSKSFLIYNTQLKKKKDSL